jgi:predicted flap endonuclease-1-like 5' DNA nuclease
MTEEIATRAETPAVDLAEEPGEGEAVAEVVDAGAAAKVDEGAVAVGERTETVSGKAAVSGATADVATEPLSKRGDVIERVTECPQKLARIKGIGRVYEDKLYQAGIGTYWQVATASAERLAEIFGIKDFQAVDLDAIQQGARALAEATDTVGKVWNGRQPDDLENLPGIGKTYEGRLYDAGICTWQKLAALTPEELAAILKAPSWNQPNYAAWIAYARARMASAS